MKIPGNKQKKGTSDLSKTQFTSLYHKNSSKSTDFYQDGFFLAPKTVLLEDFLYTSLSVHAVARARERKREREGFFSLKRANTFEWTISSVSNGRKAMKGNQRNLQFYLACCQTTFYLHFTPWKCKNCATFQRKLCRNRALNECIWVENKQ